jgi:hypothetical protein
VKSLTDTARFLVLVLLITGLVVTASAQSAGPLTGNSYQQLAAGYRVMYINGFADGLSSALPGPVTNGERVVLKPGVAEHLRDCLSPMTIGQIQAITEKFLADHPNVWDLDMGLLTVTALQNACP